jgi:hypothetical protein
MMAKYINVTQKYLSGNFPDFRSLIGAVSSKELAAELAISEVELLTKIKNPSHFTLWESHKLADLFGIRRMAIFFYINDQIDRDYFSS